MISVVITTYNHINYIEDAIQSVLEQNINDDIEIIIHDDASTDGTSDIVKEYAKKYPDIIKPIIQTKNQYSLGVKTLKKLTAEIAKGEYVAFLEGDDCWIDNKKLKTQYDFLSSNPSFSAVIHNAIVVDLRYDIAYLSESMVEGSREKGMSDLIIEGGGLLNPTASFFFRKRVLDGEFFTGGPVGDHFWLLTFANAGKVYWLSNPMSIYRYGTPGSFSSRNRLKTPDQVNQYCESYIHALNRVEKSVGGIYSDAFNSRRAIQERLRQFETLKYMVFTDGSVCSIANRRDYPGSIKSKVLFSYVSSRLPGDWDAKVRRGKALFDTKRTHRLLASRLAGFRKRDILESCRKTLTQMSGSSV